jgi:hypothetical protein
VDIGFALVSRGQKNTRLRGSNELCGFEVGASVACSCGLRDSMGKMPCRARLCRASKPVQGIAVQQNCEKFTYGQTDHS